MNSSYCKKIALIYILLMVGCYESNINSLEYPSFKELEYKITGGDTGIQYHTTIYENGEAVFLHYYKNQEYIISVMLLREQLDSINTFLIENKIYDLSNEYKPSQPVMDGFRYEINYHSSTRGDKNIIVDTGIEIPEELKKIIQKLFDINTFIQSNTEYGTLTTMWDQTETIKKWIFPEIVLEKKAYYYSEINNADSILNYFEEIRKDIGYNILYLDRDSLYGIYDGGIDYGYFNVYESFPTKLWYNYFQGDISIVQNTGIVRPTDEWEKIEISFDRTYVYIIDKIADNGKAIKLKLVRGRPYNN